MNHDDFVQIEQVYALYGHLLDAGDFERMTEVFTEDCVVDETGLGLGRSQGHPREMKAIVDRAIREGKQPVAHHQMNIVVVSEAGGTATCRAKAIGILPGGRAYTGDYVDEFVRLPEGWRIRQRMVAQPPH